MLVYVIYYRHVTLPHHPKLAFYQSIKVRTSIFKNETGFENTIQYGWY